MKTNQTILVADDSPELIRALKNRCENKYAASVRTATDGLETLSMIMTDPPDLLILDIDMPGADGISVCDRLSKDLSFAPLPVIILTGKSDDETIQRCKALGAHYVLKDPGMWETLDPIVCELLQGRDEATGNADEAPISNGEPEETPPSPPRVLVVDDDPDITKTIAIRLRYYGVETLQAESGMQGYWIALNQKPDVIITDHEMPEGSGEYMIGRLKGTAATHAIPVIVLTGRTIDGNKDFALERDMLGRRGAAAYLTKPLNFSELLMELRKHVMLPSADPANAKLG